uniref:Ig-like domain-containing protein n=1 Tax=Apteryx owenii TaxID=8824 RepID=A0A8B9S8A5_APTOW
MVANVDQQYWDRETQKLQRWQQTFCVDLDTLQKRYNQSGGYHTWQSMYGCDLLEDGGIRGFQQYAYDGRDFLAFDKDTLTFTAADSAAEITKKKWEADEAIAEDWKHYLENTCIEWLQKYVKYGKATLERRERPTVRVSGKESHGFLTLSCRAHGFYPRSIAINWLRKGHVQAQETKRGSTAPNSDGTYHAWASIEALAAEKDEYQCRVEHASLPEPGLFSWEPESNLLPIVIGVVVAALIIVAAIAGFVFWKSRLGRSEKGYKPATGHDGGSSSSGTGKGSCWEGSGGPGPVPFQDSTRCGASGRSDWFPSGLLPAALAPGSGIEPHRAAPMWDGNAALGPRGLGAAGSAVTPPPPKTLPYFFFPSCPCREQPRHLSTAPC